VRVESERERTSLELLPIKVLVLHFAAVFAIQLFPLTDKPPADASSITRFLPSPPSLTEPGPVSSNNHDCLVSLISTIRLD